MSLPEAEAVLLEGEPAVDVAQPGRLSVLRWILRRPASIVTWGVIAMVLLVSVFAPLLAPYSPTAQNTRNALLPPFSPGHLLGTDNFGRDQLSRLLYGARPLVVASLLSVLLALAMGFVIGIWSGYAGGLLDAVLARIMDIVLSFPLILLAIMIVAALGAGLRNLVLAIAISQMPVFARLVRALVLREVDREYVLAAHAGGFSALRIMAREISPNVLGPVIVQATSVVAVATGFAAALSYLGLGVRPPTADWGLMVKEGQEFLFVAPDLALLPGICITVFVTAVNFAGDDLRDLLDPGSRLRGGARL